MKKHLKTTILLTACIFASNQAFADDPTTPTIPSSGSAIHTSCGIWTYAPGLDFLITTGSLVEFFNDINEFYCGTTSGWTVIYNNVTYDAPALLVYDGPVPTV